MPLTSMFHVLFCFQAFFLSFIIKTMQQNIQLEGENIFMLTGYT